MYHSRLARRLLLDVHRGVKARQVSPARQSSNEQKWRVLEQAQEMERTPAEYAGTISCPHAYIRLEQSAVGLGDEKV